MTLTFEALYGIIRGMNPVRGFHDRSCLNALGAAVHCWHETGGFGARLMLENWNLAGIVCTRSWVSKGGKCFSGKTWEHTMGHRVDLVRGFRSYPSLIAFLADYSRLVKRYYPLSAESADCCWGYLTGLQNGKGGRKWATDPGYLKKLFSLTRKLAPDVLGTNADALLGGAWRAFRERELEKFLPEGVKSPSFSSHL